jgi:hypothetical protein
MKPNSQMLCPKDCYLYFWLFFCDFHSINSCQKKSVVGDGEYLNSIVFPVSFFFFLNYINSVAYWKFRANFQYFISQKQRLLPQFFFVFNFYSSSSTTDFFFDKHIKTVLLFSHVSLLIPFTLSVNSGEFLNIFPNFFNHSLGNFLIMLLEQILRNITCSSPTTTFKSSKLKCYD